MPDTPLQAFKRVCNWRVLAAVYYFCLLYALSRGLTWLGETEPLADTVIAIFRFKRQALISGLALLLMLAAIEAGLAAWRLEGRAALAWRAAGVLAGALLGSAVRIGAVLLEGGAPSVRPAWVASTVAIWSLFGGVALTLLRQSVNEGRTRLALASLAREREALRAQHSEAHLSALTAQIEPHFLFNTLAHVKRLHETTPERGRQMLASLIAYLRAALPGMRRAESTLAEELALVQHYLAILQMRMGDRLRFSIDADPALLGARLPTLVLPTLVENAIKHGLAPRPEGGHIAIRVAIDGEGLTLEVADDGVGFGAHSSGSGVGLANTRARLAAHFGDAAALALEAAQPHGVIARVRLPAAARAATP